ncbi:hypothetical protein H5410_003377, partial [Solanum commersonii]
MGIRDRRRAKRRKESKRKKPLNTTGKNQQEYSPIWKPDQSGKFNCKIAWELLRQKKDNVSTDVAVKKCGVSIPFICNCCRVKHYEENSEHLFSGGYISSKVLSSFNKSCGINMDHGQVRHKVIKWSFTKSKNEVHKMILLCLPNIFCWHMWKSRCSARFDDKKMSYWIINQQVIKTIHMTNFPGFNYRII